MSKTEPWPTLSGAGALRLGMGRERVIVTGAGGWLGLATLEMLHALLGEAIHDRVVCFGSHERTLRLRGGLELTQRPLAAMAELPAKPSLLLHLAFLTQEKARTLSPEAYAAANWTISLQVMTALDRVGVQKVFLASSGAAYVADDPKAARTKRLYGALKKEDEDRFIGWAEDGGGRLVIARIFNLAGPYINKRASYALACFIADVLADRAIEISASHRVYRSYVAVEELMSVSLGALTAEPSGIVRFDTAGAAVLEIDGVAHAVADTLAPRLAVRRVAMTRDLPDRYVGDAAAYNALRDALGVRPVDLPEQIRQTAAFMAEWPEEEALA
ncbi:MAG TPA: NAD(P)-dependent oxidoreductase [Caulobacteraceae bacterium]